MADCDLRLGPWERALADVGMVDALISDPPYSDRTHAGHNDAVRPAREGDTRKRRSLNYEAWKPEDVHAFVRAWVARVRGWFVVCTDHTLMPHWERALTDHDRYVFAPLHFIAPGSRVRLAGDGPACWSVSIIVARPRTAPWSKWGSLPGGYVLPPHQGGASPVIGGKPEWLMRALVRDYTRAADVIVDPCAGGATTLIAARAEGRHSIGAEVDPRTYELARKRLAKPWTPNLFGDTHAR